MELKRGISQINTEAQGDVSKLQILRMIEAAQYENRDNLAMLQNIIVLFIPWWFIVGSTSSMELCIKTS